MCIRVLSQAHTNLDHFYIGLSTFQNLGGTIFGRKYLVNRRAARRRKHAKANGKYVKIHAETCENPRENPQKTRENAFIY